MMWFGRSGFVSRQREGLFTSGSRTQTAFNLMGNRFLSDGPKAAEVSADHSLPSYAEVKYAYRFTSTPHRGFHGVVLKLILTNLTK